MLRFKITLAVVCAGLLTLVVYGAQPERRYANGKGCIYRLIYKAKGSIGLVVAGGSQMRTAVDVSHMERLLAQRGIPFDPVNSVAKSHYSLAGEHLLIRDLIAERRVKAVLVMIEPAKSVGTLRDWVPALAGMPDLPDLWRALEGSDIFTKLEIARQVLVGYIKPTNDGMPPNFFAAPAPQCMPPDVRLDIRRMEKANTNRRAVGTAPLRWNFDDPIQRNLVDAVVDMKKFADQYGVELIYIVLSRTDDPLPDSQVQQDFLEATGAELIVFDRKTHDWLAENGRRDRKHMNREGREVFTPWLIDQITAVCRNPEGCF